MFPLNKSAIAPPIAITPPAIATPAPITSPIGSIGPPIAAFIIPAVTSVSPARSTVASPAFVASSARVDPPSPFASCVIIPSIVFASRAAVIAPVPTVSTSSASATDCISVYESNNGASILPPEPAAAKALFVAEDAV